MEHHGQENQQERQVEQQAHRGARHELPDGLDALQASHQHAGRPLLEERQRKAQQVAEDPASEHRVDPVAGVQDQVLAQPRHHGGEYGEERQRDGDNHERRFRPVHDHLVDENLSEERRRQADQLD